MQQKERFADVMEHNDLSWAKVEEIVAACDAVAGFWDPAFLESAVAIAKKAVVRKYIRELKDEQGMPLWHSILTVEADGEEVRRYKQEALFDPADYMQTIDYYVERTTYNIRMATTLRDRVVKRYNVTQLILPWE